MNSFAPIDPSLVDVSIPPSGYTAKHEAADRAAGAMRMACGASARSMPESLRVDPSEWRARAQLNDELHAWPLNHVDRFTNQSPTDECTTHSLRTNAECAWNRNRGIIFPDGPKKNFRYPESALGSVWFSPLSIYSEANPNQRGGAMVIQVMDIAQKRGFLPDKIQPAEYGFKHSLQGTCGAGGMNQSSGPWVRLRDFPAGWQETAKSFRPLEVILPESYEDAVSLVLNGYCVSVGRNGHAIPWSFFRPDDGMMGYIDSYDVIRYDSNRIVRSAWRGSFAIATMTQPGDWSKPAG